MSEEISRRGFLRMTASAAVGMAAVPSCTREGRSRPGSFYHLPIDEKLLPLCDGDPGDAALTRRYPWLHPGENSRFLQLVPVGSLPDGSLCDLASGLAGERIVRLPSGAKAVPWAPMFRRPTRVYRAGSGLAPDGIGRLFVKDEGSASCLLFGNKIRKYEFSLPNLACAGVRTLRTHGAYGSNHVAYLTLAARYGRYRSGGRGGIDVEASLYPQELSDNVIAKLRLLVASGARLDFFGGDTSVGISIVGEELRSRSFPESSVAYMAPGGSSPLTVLGHVEAMMELAEAIESGTAPLDTPPDYIFVPLGSGATSMGLVLGCYLLGWPTRVVGTCSQDKGRLARLAVNGDAETPFLLAHAASLLEKSLTWVAAMGLAPKGETLPTARQLLARFFACDSESWHPAYGQVSPETGREAARAAEAGLVLDNTFTAKSFHTLVRYARAGLLRKRSCLFWNTYHRFPLETLLPADENWRQALPDPVRERVEAYERHQAGSR